jgi:pyridoxine 5-phosphate synthase
VPGKPGDASEGAKIEVPALLQELEKTVRDFRSPDRRVGLWLEPEMATVKAAASLGVDYVKFSLARLAELKGTADRTEFLEQASSVFLAAAKMGLGIAVEGGVDFHNAAEVAALGKIHHVVAGGALTGRALSVGMEQAVRDMTGLVH